MQISGSRTTFLAPCAPFWEIGLKDHCKVKKVRPLKKSVTVGLNRVKRTLFHFPRSRGVFYLFLEVIWRLIFCDPSEEKALDKFNLYIAVRSKENQKGYDCFE